MVVAVTQAYSTTIASTTVPYVKEYSQTLSDFYVYATLPISELLLTSATNGRSLPFPFTH